jgi:hypothetical protein
MAIAQSAQSAAHAVNRPHLYAIAILALIANAIVATVGATLAALGPGAALADGLGLSWAFWLSSALCVRLALVSAPRPAERADWLAAGACVLVAAVPVGPLSAVAATALGLWLMASGRFAPKLRASGMVLVAIAVHLLWGRLMMLFFAAPIAAVDARLVGLLTHTAVEGNTVRFLQSGHRLAILQACTSVQNASIALMMMIAIIRTFRPRPRASEWLYVGGAFLLVVAINEVRLSLMARSIEMFELIHGPVGATVINLIITCVGLAGAALAVRREILA